MKLNILLLCNKPNLGNDANTIIDHIEAIANHSQHKIWVCSMMGNLSNRLDLNRFDVVIIHYSLCLLGARYLSHGAKNALRSYAGLKVVFIQDEYRQINKIISELSFLNADVLFTCFPEQEINRIYSKDKLPNLSKYNNLTGYFPQRLIDPPRHRPVGDRSIHVGYRGRLVPFWYGELAYEKSSIVDKWRQHASRDDIKVDISYKEKDRIYGLKWIEFLLSCKTTLGVESGASVMDFTGDLEKKTDLHQFLYPNDSFQTVQKKYLIEHEGKYKLNQISPRCFEAIALKTVLVLYEGEYSGILVPGRHYIELKKDFSNIKSVLANIRDDVFLQKMADTAFDEIALNPKYGYKTFVADVDQVILSEFAARAKNRITIAYTKEEYQRDVRIISLKNKFYKFGLARYQKLSPSMRLFIKGMLRPRMMVQQGMRIVIRWIRFGQGGKDSGV